MEERPQSSKHETKELNTVLLVCLFGCLFSYITTSATDIAAASTDGNDDVTTSIHAAGNISSE